MAKNPPSPVPTSKSASSGARAAQARSLADWLTGLSWVLGLLLIPLALTALGLEAGFLAGRPHG
jgi:hypothetical protein